MIIYSKTKEDVLNHIYNDKEELKNIKILYQNKLKVFNKYLIKLNEKIQKEEKMEELNVLIELLYKTEENLKYFRKQIKKSKRKIEVLHNIEQDIDKIDENSLEERIKQYNQNFNSFKKELIEHSIIEEQLALQYIEKNIFNEIETNDKNNDFVKKEDVKLEKKENDEDIIKDNDTLIISEIQNKVILPYKSEEIKEILANSENNDSDIQKIIEENFTVPLKFYKYASISRYRETFALMRKKEQASLLDSLDLALELMKNRYVHPAIITACKNSDQLDVYLDCLETNELDDFPFFKIKYELYPMKIKTKEFDFEDMPSRKNILGFFRKAMPKNLQEDK